MARAAARQEAADAAARARGEYVPSVAMRAHAGVMATVLVQRAPEVFTGRGALTPLVQPVREGVYLVQAGRHAERVAQVLTRDGAEVLVRDGAVWIRVERLPFAADPFVVDGTATDNPPF